MLPKTTTSLPTVRVNATAASGSSLMVNNRNLGTRGSMSQGFGTNSASAREKMQLRHLMAKSNNDIYANNPVAQRRVQQQIATKAGQLYGMDPKRLMGSANFTASSGGITNNARSSSAGSPASQLPGGESGRVNYSYSVSANASLAQKMQPERYP